MHLELCELKLLAIMGLEMGSTVFTIIRVYCWNLCNILYNFPVVNLTMLLVANICVFQIVPLFH